MHGCNGGQSSVALFGRSDVASGQQCEQRAVWCLCKAFGTSTGVGPSLVTVAQLGFLLSP